MDIHPTKLSRILNEKEKPNIELRYRLGVHSDGEILAHYWWRMYSRQFANKIKADMAEKLDEARKVKGQLDIQA